MKIGIIGAGNIGATLARKLASAGHDIKIANSKGPESLREIAEETGAKAVAKAADLFANVPADVTVIDTSNYYPFRDGEIEGVDNGKPESVWASDQIGRPVVKAWNAALAATLAERGKQAGMTGRIALPVAGDEAGAKAVAMELVEATGFDALDAGPLADSWRQQPGTPAYCTELALAELTPALAAADKQRAPENRESLIKQFMARYGELTHDDTIAMNKAGTA